MLDDCQGRVDAGHGARLSRKGAGRASWNEDLREVKVSIARSKARRGPAGHAPPQAARKGGFGANGRWRKSLANPELDHRRPHGA